MSRRRPQSLRLLPVLATAVLAIGVGYANNPASAHGAGNVVPDPVFQACLNGYLGQSPTADITAAQLATIVGTWSPFVPTRVWCGDPGITSIEGAQHLTATHGINLSGSVNLTDLSPLAGMTNMTAVVATHAGITDLTPLTTLPNLTVLDLADCPGITDFTPLADMTKLTQLSLANLSLTNFGTNPPSALADLSPLAGLTGLTSLGLAGHPLLTDIRALAGLTALTELDLRYTGVSDLTPLAGLTALTGLYLSQTGVSDVTPLAGLTALTNLDLMYDHIVDLRPVMNLPVATTSIPDTTPLSIGLRAQAQSVTLPSVTPGTYPLPSFYGLRGQPADQLYLRSGSAIASIDPVAGTITYTNVGAVQIAWVDNQVPTSPYASPVFWGIATVNVYLAPVTVTFDTGLGGTLPQATVDAGTAVGTAMPPDPTRTDFRFDGWFTHAGVQFTADTVVMADLTVYAKWTDVSVPKVTLTFSGNGGTDPVPSQVLVPVGAAIAPDTFTAGPHWDGHKFTGWNTVADGTGTRFLDSTIVTKAMTLYAQWTPLDDPVPVDPVPVNPGPDTPTPVPAADPPAGPTVPGGGALTHPAQSLSLFGALGILALGLVVLAVPRRRSATPSLGARHRHY